MITIFRYVSITCNKNNLINHFYSSNYRSACIEEESGIYQPMETVRRMPVTINPHSTSASGYPQQRHERDMQIYTQYQRSLRQTSPVLGITTGDETEDR